MDLHISLDRSNHLATEIYGQLRRRILDGDLRAGDRLPPSRELARRLEVSRTTVVTAYDRLTGEGFLEAYVGAGTFVSDQVTTADPAPQAHRGDQALQPRAVWDAVTVPSPAGPEPAFDFRPGLPDATLFPHAAWRRLITRELHPRRVGTGTYGDPCGHEGLRSALSRHLAVARGVEATAEDIVITNGTQQAVDLIARALLEPGDVVAVEDPGYTPPARLLSTLGARVHGVPVDREGLVVDALPARARLIVVSPSHQFPLGSTMSLRRRLALLDWARTHDAAILEDDYDSEFRFDGRPVEPLRSLDDEGHVIYVGTFSKTMLPTLRLGFVVVPRSLRHAVRAAKFVTDWHSSVPSQAALAQFLDEGLFTRHVRRMRHIYEQRYRLLLDILERDFTGLLRPLRASAGLHTTALVVDPDATDLHAAAADARDHGVALHLLAHWQVTTEPPAGVVLGYGSIDTQAIPPGLELLREALIRTAGNRYAEGHEGGVTRQG